MGLIKVWAPDARYVEAAVGNSRLEMEQARGGWWVIDTPIATHGVDYAFALDGGPPLPDPRSPWQPSGIHGPSRILDHGAWPKPAYLSARCMQ